MLNLETGKTTVDSCEKVLRNKQGFGEQRVQMFEYLFCLAHCINTSLLQNISADYKAA